MRCERCGKEISDTAAICPSCGSLTSAISSGQPAGQPPTQHGTYPTDAYDEPVSSYEQGYTPRSDFRRPPQPDYMPPPQSDYQYGQSYAPPRFQQGGRINIGVYNSYTPPGQKNNGALVAEIILSLFGIYGVGWLIGGETAIGIILLVCSFVIYLPFVIIGIILTLGLGIFCIGPLSIAAIIVNAILLNNALKRKAAQHITIIHAQQMPPPPQYPRS
ncbi:MAG TPA: zinc ribbon domain-containing protein [Ktedonobacteraceae bacterium]|nr:zinc ribbon domain-containing protein [Ktedonobacteraceae bacterium]